MIRRLVLLLCLAAPVRADPVADLAAQAAEDLRGAIAALDAATGARDRVAALTDTIRAYEEGLAALREALRQAELRATSLRLSFGAKSDRIAQLLAVLSRMEADPAPLALLHPDGPLGTARSGMMLAEVTPALQAEAAALRAELTELAELRALQVGAEATLTQGLAAVQDARTALSQAMSDRTDLPRRFTEDPEALAALVNSADTLDAFAQGLSVGGGDVGGQSFAAARGRLPLPALARLLRAPGEADAAGVRRPGIALATRPGALVTSPWPATIRYRGPLLDYGNVIVLEPGDGYLLVLAGLGTVYGEVGEVAATGAALGLMGDPVPAGSEFASSDTGAGDTETLYLELRQGAEPVNPMPWFAGLAPATE